MKRGDTFRVNLDPAIGTKVGKTRPAVALQNDSIASSGARKQTC